MNTLQEKGFCHGTHIEDEILQGPEGLQRMINFFNQTIAILEKDSKDNSVPDPTVKIDGAPALTFGSNFPGFNGPFVSTKSIFNANPKVYQTIADIESDNRPVELKEKLKIALQLVQDKSFQIPPNEIWQGDLLWTIGDTKEIPSDGLVYVQPNTLVYAAPKNSEIGQAMLNKKIGIVFHTRYKGNNISTVFKTNDIKIEQLGQIPDWAFVIDARLPNTSGQTTWSEQESKVIHEVFSELKSLVPSISENDDYKVLCNNEEFIQFYFQTLQNYKVDQQIDIHPESFVSDLHHWITKKMHKNYNDLGKLKTTKGKNNKRSNIEVMSKELHDIVEKNSGLIKDMANMISLATELKSEIMDKMEQASQFITMIQKKSGGFEKTVGEGFVVSDVNGNFVKLVDRKAFSMFNRSIDIVKGWDSDKRQKINETINKELKPIWGEEDDYFEFLNKSKLINNPAIGRDGDDGKDYFKKSSTKIEWCFILEQQDPIEEILKKIKEKLGEPLSSTAKDGKPVYVFNYNNKKLAFRYTGSAKAKSGNEKNAGEFFENLLAATMSYITKKKLYKENSPGNEVIVSEKNIETIINDSIKYLAETKKLGKEDFNFDKKYTISENFINKIKYSIEKIVKKNEIVKIVQAGGRETKRPIEWESDRPLPKSDFNDNSGDEQIKRDIAWAVADIIIYTTDLKGKLKPNYISVKAGPTINYVGNGTGKEKKQVGVRGENINKFLFNLFPKQYKQIFEKLENGIKQYSNSAFKNVEGFKDLSIFPNEDYVYEFLSSVIGDNYSIIHYNYTGGGNFMTEFINQTVVKVLLQYATGKVLIRFPNYGRSRFEIYLNEDKPVAKSPFGRLSFFMTIKGKGNKSTISNYDKLYLQASYSQKRENIFKEIYQKSLKEKNKNI